MRSLRFIVTGWLMLSGIQLVHGQSVSSTSTSAQTPARIEQSEGRVTREDAADITRAKDFGLSQEEWARYRELMRGPLGIYSPNLDPLTALGIEARSADERRHIAELQVRLEARRVEKTLAYQRAYDEAWKRVYPGMQAVRTEPARTPHTSSSESRGDGRMAVFVRENCPACDARVKGLQASGSAFDIYVVGTRHDDARIRQWARAVGIDAEKVRAGLITLNHDGGRWLSLGQPGALPAVLRSVDGQWQRQ